MKTTKQLLSARQAAKRLGVSHVTVLDWVRAGKLTPLGQVDGGTVVFDPAYIDQVAREREANQAPPALTLVSA
jgi:excisionase family DNA binding protein